MNEQKVEQDVPKALRALRNSVEALNRGVEPGAIAWALCTLSVELMNQLGISESDTEYMFRVAIRCLHWVRLHDAHVLGSPANDNAEIVRLVGSETFLETLRRLIGTHTLSLRQIAEAYVQDRGLNSSEAKRITARIGRALRGAEGVVRPTRGFYALTHICPD